MQEQNTTPEMVTWTVYNFNPGDVYHLDFNDINTDKYSALSNKPLINTLEIKLPKNISDSLYKACVKGESSTFCVVKNENEQEIKAYELYHSIKDRTVRDFIYHSKELGESEREYLKEKTSFCKLPYEYHNNDDPHVMLTLSDLNDSILDELVSYSSKFPPIDDYDTDIDPQHSVGDCVVFGNECDRYSYSFEGAIYEPSNNTVMIDIEPEREKVIKAMRCMLDKECSGGAQYAKIGSILDSVTPIEAIGYDEWGTPDNPIEFSCRLGSLIDIYTQGSKAYDKLFDTIVDAVKKYERERDITKFECVAIVEQDPSDGVTYLTTPEEILNEKDFTEAGVDIGDVFIHTSDGSYFATGIVLHDKDVSMLLRIADDKIMMYEKERDHQEVDIDLIEELQEISPNYKAPEEFVPGM